MLFNAAVLFVLACTAAWSDIRERRVSNRLNVAILVAGLGWRAAEGGWTPLVGVAGAVLGIALLLGPFAARWIGAGDVKLTAAFGAWLGPADIVWSTLAGFALGGLLSLVIVWAAGTAVRRDVTRTFTVALLSRCLPRAPRRADGATVPMALPLGIAAVATFLFASGVL